MNMTGVEVTSVQVAAWNVRVGFKQRTQSALKARGVEMKQGTPVFMRVADHDEDGCVVVKLYFPRTEAAK